DTTGARIESVAWIAADGPPLASATRTPDGAGQLAWVVAGLVQPSRNALSTTRYLAPRYTGPRHDTGAAHLLSGARGSGSEARTASGAPRRGAALLQGPGDLAGRALPAVAHAVDHWYAVTGEGLVATARVAANGGTTASAVSDAGDLLRVTNEAGD